ncbi:predicted protein [Sclerotinia sclerotiorum 1980 UF-70]|uniref:Uncharacterized protein n=1 Tax=Sclerotinia sclerotiorum (strain ATCC 18683 / 1980 / Ss-1) TaxID=665079 RepID=A7E6E8_SCLS1|nr:predicted protein [Sclerotinia sclerotiorum 1980 UF-70]EDN91470.1 predicted protein [Sclerotinia sclerotiorum 1980 UF-70]
MHTHMIYTTIHTSFVQKHSASHKFTTTQSFSSDDGSLLAFLRQQGCVLGGLSLKKRWVGKQKIRRGSRIHLEIVMDSDGIHTWKRAVGSE